MGTPCLVWMWKGLGLRDRGVRDGGSGSIAVKASSIESTGGGFVRRSNYRGVQTRFRNAVRERGYALANYSMQFAVHHSSCTNVWTRSPIITLTDWLESNQRSREWLEKVAKQLNSTGDLDATGGEFYAQMTFVKNPGRGAGRKGKKHNPGRMSCEALLKKKNCII